VYHVPADGGDQTAFINGLGAVSGDTIFFDQGNHQVCGTVNEVAGVLYIGPTVTYPILGQNSRAVLDGCGYVGKFVPANKAMVYGLTMNNFDRYVLVGTSGHKFRNNLLDMHNSSVDGSGNQEWLCNGGDTNTVIDWNTFQNGSGINNGECSQVGSGSTNFC
jgi:hypothetical protein